MNEENDSLADIGTILSEDNDCIEVLFDGHDVRAFLLEIAQKESNKLCDKQVIGHLRALNESFINPLRARYEIRIKTPKLRYSVANEAPTQNLNKKMEEKMEEKEKVQIEKKENASALSTVLMLFAVVMIIAAMLAANNVAVATQSLSLAFVAGVPMLANSVLFFAVAMLLRRISDVLKLLDDSKK